MEKTKESAESVQATLINNFLKNYEKEASPRIAWKRPAGLQSLRTNLISGKVNSQNGRFDYYSTDMRLDSPIETTVYIDKATNKLATDCTPEKSLRILKTGTLLAELPDTDKNYKIWMHPIWYNLGQRLDASIPTEKDDLHKCTDRPPTFEVETKGNCQKGCQLTITATAGTHDLKTLSITTSDQRFNDFSVEITGRTSKTAYNYENLYPSVKSLKIEIADLAFYSRFFDS